MIGIKVKGLDETIENLRNLQNKLEEMEGEHEIPIEELMTEDFMKKHTKYENFHEFVIDSKLIPENTTKITKEIFENIPDEDFDNYVINNTDFHSWEEMIQASVKEYTLQKLKL